MKKRLLASLLSAVLGALCSYYMDNWIYFAVMVLVGILLDGYTIWSQNHIDKKVMEFAEHVPARFRVNENGNKQVLRHAANRCLPDEWATRPKKGFPVPLKFWLREQKYYDYVKEYFTAPWAEEFFDTKQLMQMLDDHFAGKALNQRKIYTALTFLIWYKRYFIDE